MSSNRVFVGFLALLLLISGLSSRPPQQTGDIYFEEEGLWVRGAFADFYHAAPDAERIFGVPLTEAMDDRVRPGIQVQYFERARMDYDPTMPEGQRVTLANLGDTLRDDSIPRETPDYSSYTNMCRTFSNERSVCFAFLQFYDSHDGALYFGEPIANTESEDGLIVQYFERTRMEWRPDRPTGQRVVLTELGRLDYIRNFGQGGRNIINRSLSQLTVYAFVAKPVIGEGEEQQVFFVVYDQRGNPIPDASVIFTVEYPQPEADPPVRTEAFRVEKLTNAEGFTSTNFIVKNVLPNQMVKIDATARLDGGNESTAKTWFRTWW